MDLDASIVERLQKLRQWQIEQQECLLKQQQMQREILTNKQKALELSIQGLDLDESTLDSNEAENYNEKYRCSDNKNKMENDVHQSTLLPNKNVYCLEAYKHDKSETDTNLNTSECLFSEQDSSNNLYTIITELVDTDYRVEEQPTKRTMSDMKNYSSLAFTPQKQEKLKPEYMIDGVALLSDEKPNAHISIDDVPVPSPKKDFQTLLEERLKDSENIDHNEKPKVKVKRPFLRKGDGLSRFRLNQTSQPSGKNIRPRSASVSSNTRLPKQNKKHEIKNKNVVQRSKQSESKKNVSTANSGRQQLSLKNVPQPKQRVRSKSECISSSSKLGNFTRGNRKTVELNTSDFHSKTEKEMEEVRVFELLEEKAENSSFCSTSSTVVAFLQQSTPFKTRKELSGTKADIVNVNNRMNKISHQKISNESEHQSLKIQMHDPCIQSNNIRWDSVSSVGHRESQQPSVTKRIMSNIQIDAKRSQNSNESNKENTNIRKDGSLGHHMQYLYDQEDAFDTPDTRKTDELDVSVHVRFSEYNEYKTIGLTDTSSESSESLTIKQFCDHKAWNDSYTSEVSDIDMLLTDPKEPETTDITSSATQIDNQELKSVEYNVSEEVDYRMKNLESQNNNFNYDKDGHKNVYDDEEDLEFSDTIEQSSNDEQSMLDHYSRNDLPLIMNDDCHKSDKLKECKQEGNLMLANKCTNSYSDELIVLGEGNEENSQDANGRIFKSELLKNRLLELEREIDIFRKENAALALQRQKLKDDHRKLLKEYMEKERNIEESKKQSESRLQEEKKKLAREKAALESRIRDSQEKAQQNKLERQEMQTLRQEFEQLKDEMNLKESRWNAAQSRQKCQMRILKMENSKLKQEIEKLQNSKKANNKNKGKPEIRSNAKAIHQINKEINMKTKELQKVINDSSSDSEHKLIEPMLGTVDVKLDIKDKDNLYSADNNYDGNSNKYNVYETLQKSQNSMTNVVKKRTLYENLIKEATTGLTEIQQGSTVEDNIRTSKPGTDNQVQNADTRKNEVDNTYKNSMERANMSSDHADVRKHTNVQKNDYTLYTSPIKISEGNQNSRSPIPSKELSASAGTMKTPCKNKIDDEGTRCIKHEDGRVEYWYSNGNVKKIFPDQSLTKMIYYNGDVRETDNDGKIKYFYASTCTWHTTMPDGLEILEFPDGQVERRSKNGTVEVSFPDGSIRILESNGSEKWALTDGTMVQTFTSGDKILTLPNGQREIHTKTHKRREYPDGTVKFVYPDGTQETRYSNGRMRLKDKDGNLLMDSC